jgi:hypothetical protein
MPFDNDPGGNCDRINALHAAQRSKKKQQVERRRWMQLVASLVCTVIAFTASLNLDVPDDLPMHTLMLTGQMWLNELLAGHPWEGLGFHFLRPELGLKPGPGSQNIM